MGVCYGRNVDGNKWKDNLGRWKVVNLFIDLYCDERNRHAIYTTYDDDFEKDGVKYPSLRKIYLAFDHVPHLEYDFADKFLGGWKHWQELCKSKTLAPHIQEWRETLEVKLQAKALRSMINTSYDDTPTGFNAKKYLADKGWMEKKGRPKKEDIEREAKKQARVEDEIAGDLARIRVVK